MLVADEAADLRALGGEVALAIMASLTWAR